LFEKGKALIIESLSNLLNNEQNVEVCDATEA
jgi:hypothetical protein